MKICHVCKAECEESIELCPICGADLSEEKQDVFEEEIIEEVQKQNTEDTENAQEADENTIKNPVLLASLEDVVSAEIFKDILISNNIPYSCIGNEGETYMRVVFGGSFSAEEIYVDNKDYDKANELYVEFINSESEFDGDFFEEEFTEEE